MGGVIVAVVHYLISTKLVGNSLFETNEWDVIGSILGRVNQWL